MHASLLSSSHNLFCCYQAQLNPDCTQYKSKPIFGSNVRDISWRVYGDTYVLVIIMKLVHAHTYRLQR